VKGFASVAVSATKRKKIVAAILKTVMIVNAVKHVEVKLFLI
jgi:hypothetical protein